LICVLIFVTFFSEAVSKRHCGSFGVRHGVATNLTHRLKACATLILHLHPPRSSRKVARRLLPRGIADLDVVYYLQSAGGLRHPRRGALMLNHIGAAFPGNDAALDVKREAVLADLRLGQLGPDVPLDFGVAEVGTSRVGRGSGSLRLDWRADAGQQNHTENVSNFAHKLYV
jgi:hypothetical protein